MIKDNIVLLIDIENISYRSIPQLMKKINSYKDETENRKIISKYAFANWNTEINKEWYKKIKEYEIEKKQTLSFSKRKNSADIELVISAMELLYTEDIQTFIIVTGDSDFTSLIHKLKESNKKVILSSDGNSATILKKATDIFWELNVPNQKKKSEEKKAIKENSIVIKDKKRLSNLALSIFNNKSKNNKADMSYIYSEMKRSAESEGKIVDFRKMGYSKLKPFFKNLMLFEFEEENKGNNKSYYLKRKRKK